jgi:lipoprotein-releasing system ATP-binding protein
MEKFVQLDEITKKYPSPEGSEAVEVFGGINLTLASGSSNAIVGPSGSGKSTLLNLIGALDKPTSGNIRVDGKALAGMSTGESARFRNQTVGFVFQSHHLLPSCTVLENVMVPALAGSGDLKGKALQDRAKSLLEEVGLGHRTGHRPGEISGGERQRVAVARSLINEPSLLLADEPTGALDKSNSEKLVDLIVRLNESRTLTLILVTHSQETARRMDTGFLLDEGGLEKI